MQNKKIIIGANLRFSGSCHHIIVFRLVAYLLNMICLILELFSKLHTYEFLYKFDTVLDQFLKTGTPDRCLIGIVQNLIFSRFSLYPLLFFLYFSFVILDQSKVWRIPVLNQDAPLHMEGHMKLCKQLGEEFKPIEKKFKYM